MFLTHDELVILRDMGPTLLAACEGVVGWVKRDDVDLSGMDISGLGPRSPLPMRESLLHEGVGEGMPRTVVVSPSPSPSPPTLAHQIEDEQEGPLDAESLSSHASAVKTRTSNQFDLDSPLPTPKEDGSASFATQQERPRQESRAGKDEQSDGSQPIVTAADRARLRESLASFESDTSSALGGIGGLLMGSGSGGDATAAVGAEAVPNGEGGTRRESEEESLAYGREAATGSKGESD